MKNNIRLVIILVSLSCLATEASAHPSDSLIFMRNRLLDRTINLGYVVEAGRSAAFKDSIYTQLEIIKKAGFHAIRLPISWITAMDSSDAWAIDPSFLKLIDQMVDKALALQLSVILDNHADEQLMNDPAHYGSRIFSLWQQLSVHYKNCSDSLMFELLAESHGNLNAYWNMLLIELLKIIRISNPVRPVIVGPVNYNRPDFLNQLVLPQDDRHIIVSFHQYSPVKFTMQGETWFPFGKPLEWLGTPWPQKGDEDFLISLFDRVNTWSTTNHRPVSRRIWSFFHG